MPEGDFVRATGWWAFIATIAAAGLGLWGVKESRSAEHWKAAHGEAWRVIGETGAELRECRERVTR